MRMTEFESLQHTVAKYNKKNKKNISVAEYMLNIANGKIRRKGIDDVFDRRLDYMNWKSWRASRIRNGYQYASFERYLEAKKQGKIKRGRPKNGKLWPMT